MDYSHLLNKEQLEAVQTTNGPVMVSAGAGSGKTRVLTYRVAYLITECGVAPYNILAITFTNKAANEMKERISRIAENGDLVTVCTFHSLCAKLLRSYASLLGDYDSNFSIYTEQDQNKVFKEVFKKLNINDDKMKSDIMRHVLRIKTDGVNVDEYIQIHKQLSNIEFVHAVYNEYQRELIKNNAMDFDDLLINFYKLLKTNEEVRTSVQRKYKYIHIDEFQDTNALQYEIIKIMAEAHRNILIVGDEDQSIYSWRGADISNIYKFKNDFKDYKLIKLEQNYRSTKAVLNKANQLIQNNKDRLEKVLWTANAEGDEVIYFSANDEGEEADYVIRNIMLLHSQGIPYNEMSVLMRLNSLTRSFEEKFLAYNIPHRIYNGTKFYERAEIKSTLAYLVAVANPNDDNNILRLINFPKRKIGDASIGKLQELALAYKCSLKQIILESRTLDMKSQLKDKIAPLADLLQTIDDEAKDAKLYDLMSFIVERAGILESFDKSDDGEYERFLNVNSLLKSIKDYSEANPDSTYIDYLQTISLTTQIDEEDKKNGVVIATVHGVKGLEFKVVFVVGLEEKIFPISRDENNEIEEERRLMYVAITRAKEKLFVTNAKTRFMYGKRDATIPSRFLKEMGMIKDKVFDYISPYGSYATRYQNSNRSKFDEPFDSFKEKSEREQKYNYYREKYGHKKSQGNSYPVGKVELSSIQGITKGFKKNDVDPEKVKVGAKVFHSKFGNGTIVDISDFTKNRCVAIDFGDFGKKSLSLDYAPIIFK